MIVWFNTPAFQRYALSEIVFEQRARAIEKLSLAGIEAHQVVVADDENLELARSFGFETFERDNEWLGKRFSDGYEYAVEHGATHVFPIGSDSWCDPQFVIDAVAIMESDRPNKEKPRDLDAICSRHYTRVNGLGTIRRQLWVPVLQGVSYLIPATVLSKLDRARPCQDEISRGCDGSTWQSCSRAGCGAFFVESHPLETTSFESWPQITMFDKLGGRWGRGDVEDGAISGLVELYPRDLVEKIDAFYEKRRGEMVGLDVTAGDLEKRVKEITLRVLTANKIPSIVRQKSRPYIEQAVRIALTEGR